MRNAAILLLALAGCSGGTVGDADPSFPDAAERTPDGGGGSGGAPSVDSRPVLPVDARPPSPDTTTLPPPADARPTSPDVQTTPPADAHVYPVCMPKNGRPIAIRGGCDDGVRERLKNGLPCRLCRQMTSAGTIDDAYSLTNCTYGGGWCATDCSECSF